MFGFQKVEHKVFNKNFLRKVVFRIEFKTIELKKIEVELKTYLKDKFPRVTNKEGNGIQISFDNNQPKFKTVTESSGFVLKNASGKVVLEVSNDNMVLSFDNNIDYVSFNNSLVYLESIIGFLKDVLGINEIQQYSCRKINIIEFENNHNPNGIVYFLLNNALVGNIDYFPNMESINHNLQSVNYANAEYFLNLKYGMNIPPGTGSKFGQVIIDIDLIRKESFKIEDFFGISSSMNSELFNVFNWIASDNLKNILNG